MSAGRSRVPTAFWTNETFKHLSTRQKLIALFLMTGTGRRHVDGVQMSMQFGASISEIAADLNVLAEAGLAKQTPSGWYADRSWSRGEG